METTILNDQLRVTILHKGAELRSVRSNITGIEYIWQADPAFWGKSSPILFPIVGQLRNNTYRYRGTEYGLPRHGFARDLGFELRSKSNTEATFTLESNAETLTKYPFRFSLSIQYSLSADQLLVTYSVVNRSEESMLFSLGAHPAFRIPLSDGLAYDDYYLRFSQVESARRWTVNKDGLIERKSQPLLMESDRLNLTRDLFRDDALVFKDLSSDVITIASDKSKHGIDFTFREYPYFGIWAAPNADFVCLEPWCGIADHIDHDGSLENKEGINILSTGGTWKKQWSIRCF